MLGSCKTEIAWSLLQGLNPVSNTEMTIQGTFGHLCSVIQRIQMKAKHVRTLKLHMKVSESRYQNQLHLRLRKMLQFGAASNARLRT